MLRIPGRNAFLHEERETPMLLQIYRLPLWGVMLIMLAAVALWAGLERVMERPPKRLGLWRGVNGGLLAGAVGVILYTTLLNRSLGAREVCLIPFASLSMAGEQPELYRAMLMNVLLFVPLGLALSGVLPRSWTPRRRFWIAAAAGLMLSGLVEGLQFAFALGRAETDDVICNTAGAALGGAAGLLRLALDRSRR